MSRIVVDTLELQEIAEIVREELDRTKGKLSSFSGKYNRLLIHRKPKERLDLPPIEWRGKSGIRYHFLPFVRNYSDYKKGGLSFQLYGDFLYRGGLFSLFAVNNLSMWIFYSPHFFQRYRERVIKSEEIDLSETMERYFRINDISKMQETDKGIFAPTTDGVSLGEKIGSLFLMKTFISTDMLREDQVLLRADGMEDVLRQYIANSNYKTERQLSQV